MTCPQGLCVPSESNKPVPLKDIKVEASIQGFVCKVTSRLLYENVEDNAIEAVFVFPMDDDSVAYQFEAEIDDRKIVAECQAREEAQQTYDDAVSQGFTSVLLEQDQNSADIFQCSVGNLPPHKSAVIRFSYVKELPLTLDGGVQFVLPTLLNPRYNPKPEDGGATSSKLGDAVNVSPNAVPYSFVFEATVTSNKTILNIKSDHEDVTSDVSDNKTSAVLTLTKNFVPDHDLSFVVYFDKIYEPSSIFAEGDENGTGILKNNIVMLNFYPEIDESAMCGEKEFIFVLDRSGSMFGQRILSAKETLLLFLKSLPADCYFNIVSFGSSHRFLFPNGSLKYSEDTLKQAYDLQSHMEADFGGTEILRPLEDIYGRPAIEGYPRQVFVLTDGEVGNTSTVIGLVKKNVDKARVFTFGIGEGASTSLVKGLARAGQGKAMFVKDEERLQPKVMKILKCAMQEGVKDVKVDVPGCPNAKVVPHPIPPLYSGDRLVVYAIIPDQTSLQSAAVLKGKLGNQILQFTVPLNSTSGSNTDLAMQRLAAKAQIATLEEDTDEKSTKSMIVLLSTSANIVSKYTSMVGVDTEKSGDGKTPMKRRIPTPAYPQGPQYGMFSAPVRMSNSFAMSTPQPLSNSLGFSFGAAPNSSFGAAPPPPRTSSQFGFGTAPAQLTFGAAPPPHPTSSQFGFGTAPAQLTFGAAPPPHPTSSQFGFGTAPAQLTFGAAPPPHPTSSQFGFGTAPAQLTFGAAPPPHPTSSQFGFGTAPAQLTFGAAPPPHPTSSQFGFGTAPAQLTFGAAPPPRPTSSLFGFGGAPPPRQTSSLFGLGGASPPPPTSSLFGLGGAPPPPPASSQVTFGAVPNFSLGGAPPPPPVSSQLTFGAAPLPRPNSSQVTFGSAPPPSPLAGGLPAKNCAPPPPEAHAGAMGLQQQRAMKEFKAQPGSAASDFFLLDCAAANEAKSNPKAGSYMKLVQLQLFSGEWHLDEALAAILGKPIAELRSAQTRITTNKVREQYFLFLPQ